MLYIVLLINKGLHEVKSLSFVLCAFKYAYNLPGDLFTVDWLELCSFYYVFLTHTEDLTTWPVILNQRLWFIVTHTTEKL